MTASAGFPRPGPPAGIEIPRKPLDARARNWLIWLSVGGLLA